MSWLRLKDIAASAANNSSKMLGISSANAALTVTAEDLVEEAIANSATVKNAFNTQVSTAITNDAGVQNSLTTQIVNANNAPGTTVTYTNPPTVGGQPLLVLPTSKDDGEHLMYEGMGTTNVGAKKLLVKASAAERTQLVNFGQASSQQRTAETFQRILNTFYRFSYTYGNLTSNHVNVTEENDWSLNANNEITQGINSGSWIGFASLDSYDTFDAIITLKSDGNDDDPIGFVIALNRGNPNDPAANTPTDNYLSVWRSLNTGGAMAGLNLGVNNATDVIAFDRTKFLPFPSTAGDWENYDGCPLKIERRPDRVTIWGIENMANAPDWNSPLWGTPVFDIVLSALPSTAQFQTPGNWGLVAYSQGECSWGDLFFNGVNDGGLTLSPQPDPAINNRVFDVQAGKSYIYVNGAWTEDPTKDVHDYVDSGQLLLDTASKSLYIKDNGELQLLQSSRLDTVILSNNSGVTVNDIGRLIIATAGCNTLTFNGNYGAGWHCTILNETGGNLKLETGGGVGAGSRFGDRLLTQNNTSFNISNGEEARCYGNGINNGANIHPVITGGNYGA